MFEYFVKAFFTPPKSVENDLRLISLTSAIATVFEGFSAEALITSVFNKLYSKQFALPGRSTTQALIFFMHNILQTLDTCGSTLEFSSQTSVKPSTLWTTRSTKLSEVNNLDVDADLVRWIAVFSTNRSHEVKTENSLSPPTGLNGWTPQGTKLAPLLFCILVNGMTAKCKSRVKYEDHATP